MTIDLSKIGTTFISVKQNYYKEDLTVTGLKPNKPCESLSQNLALHSMKLWNIWQFHYDNLLDKIDSSGAPIKKKCSNYIILHF